MNPPLPAPVGLTLFQVALGRGTQNYTCVCADNELGSRETSLMAVGSRECNSNTSTARCSSHAVQFQLRRGTEAGSAQTLASHRNQSAFANVKQHQYWRVRSNDFWTSLLRRFHNTFFQPGYRSPSLRHGRTGEVKRFRCARWCHSRSAWPAQLRCCSMA